MCGNFGLLLLGRSGSRNNCSSSSIRNSNSSGNDNGVQDNLDQGTAATFKSDINSAEAPNSASSATISVSDVSIIEDSSSSCSSKKSVSSVMSVVEILKLQTAATEIRGGQAGGFSVIESPVLSSESSSRFGMKFNDAGVYVPQISQRVRYVARKRRPLATDLCDIYMKSCGGKLPAQSSTVTAIGHTRFATSSINQESELHPHEWTEFQPETVWRFNEVTGEFLRQAGVTMGLHISHNGDFDSLECYNQVKVNEEVGLWLERVTGVKNDTKGDSPKVAGFFDLFRVQGRWAAAAKLAWIRVVSVSFESVSGDQPLSKTAPNTFPPQSFFDLWRDFLEKSFSLFGRNRIFNSAKEGISVTDGTPSDRNQKNLWSYSINRQSEVLFVKSLVKVIMKHGISNSISHHEDFMKTGGDVDQYSEKNESIFANMLSDNKLGTSKWTQSLAYSFVLSTVRGFLRHDLYNTMTEFLSRAEGSFGLQVHCTLEPGVVVVASKGQPMSIAFSRDPDIPVVLFASETEALAVPVKTDGSRLDCRLDLDNRGEIVRIGPPRSLHEGTFRRQSLLRSNKPSSGDNVTTESSASSKSSSSSGYNSSSISAKTNLPIFTPIKLFSFSDPTGTSLSTTNNNNNSNNNNNNNSNNNNNNHSLNTSSHHRSVTSSSHKGNAFSRLADRISTHEAFTSLLPLQQQQQSKDVINNINTPFRSSSHGSSSSGLTNINNINNINNITNTSSNHNNNNDNTIGSTHGIKPVSNTSANSSNPTSTTIAKQLGSVLDVDSSLLDQKSISTTATSSIAAGGGSSGISVSGISSISGSISISSNTNNSDGYRLLLSSGVEIRSYSLVSACEESEDELIHRSKPISKDNSKPLPSPSISTSMTSLLVDGSPPPSRDLVAEDLQATPSVLSKINRAWMKIPGTFRDGTYSEERPPCWLPGAALARHLFEGMRARLNDAMEGNDNSTIDLLIGGVEVSLWIAEQWAADLRTVLPQLNVVAISSNKLLDIGNKDPGKVHFPGTDTLTARRFDRCKTCVLLISQSGQTFPTLHATRKLCHLVGDKLWIMTGCQSSKMELSLKEYFKEHHLPYNNDRVINNMSGHSVTEPSSLAAAATWHSLTHLMICIVKTLRFMAPNSRVVLPWDRLEESARCIQKLRHHIRNKRKTDRSKDTSRSGSSSPLTLNPQSALVNSRSPSPSSPALDLLSPTALSISSTGTTPRKNKSSFTSPVTPRNTNGISNGNGNTSATPVPADFPFSAPQAHRAQICMLLSDGCIADMGQLVHENVVRNISQIVGYDECGVSLYRTFSLTPPSSDSSVSSSSNNIGSNKVMAGVKDDLSLPHARLVSAGKYWGSHVSEGWTVWVCASTYLVVAISLGVPVFGCLGQILTAILRRYDSIPTSGLLLFSLRFPELWGIQPPAFTVIGLILQILDAFLFVYCGFIVTRCMRWYDGRPLFSRSGKRTLVIVDNPAVHQLLESFASKLFSQSYSAGSIEIHGASGLDHFVHRFTHRVTRGTLLAVGRPDGRLCCLAKSESAVLLSVKQAAFIRNPDYDMSKSFFYVHVLLAASNFCSRLLHFFYSDGVDDVGGSAAQTQTPAQRNSSYLSSGSGPDIVTVGHNPFQPSMGDARHVVLQPHCHSVALESNLTRRKFLDEIVYERLGRSSVKPDAARLLRDLLTHCKRQQYHHKQQQQQHLTSPSLKQISHHFPVNKAPHGVHQIVPMFSEFDYKEYLQRAHDGEGWERLAFKIILQNKHSSLGVSTSSPSSSSSVAMDVGKVSDPLAPLTLSDADYRSSCNPANRLAFLSRLDRSTNLIQDMQVIVQQFYESRVASLERYVAFCVLFHSMAKEASQLVGKGSYDMSRSQSNLKVATTAAPIFTSTQTDASSDMSSEARGELRRWHEILRRSRLKF